MTFLLVTVIVYSSKNIFLIIYIYIYSIKFGNEENILYVLRNNKISKIDLNRPSEEECIIKLEGEKLIASRHLKICSDTSKLDNNHVNFLINNKF